MTNEQHVKLYHRYCLTHNLKPCTGRAVVLFINRKETAMIVRIQMKGKDNEEFTMMFGTSYKPYLNQIQDFFYRGQVWVNRLPHPLYSIISIETSKSKWKGWGGLKWCEEKDFQGELNREYRQKGEPDNPNARQYSEMEFKKNYYAKGKIMGWYNLQYQDREIVEPK